MPATAKYHPPISAHAVKMRASRLLGYGSISKIAGDLGLNRCFVSNILAGRCKAQPTLTRIERYLDGIERGQ